MLSRQFLAKLATNLAKPKGVRVLHRQDISALLASTSVTKIPGCGPGSMAAKQFAAWGAGSMLDLRRIDGGELRERLGEKLGAKVLPCTNAFCDTSRSCIFWRFFSD